MFLKLLGRSLILAGLTFGVAIENVLSIQQPEQYAIVSSQETYVWNRLNTSVAVWKTKGDFSGDQRFILEMRHKSPSDDAWAFIDWMRHITRNHSSGEYGEPVDVPSYNSDGVLISKVYVAFYNDPETFTYVFYNRENYRFAWVSGIDDSYIVRDDGIYKQGTNNKVANWVKHWTEEEEAARQRRSRLCDKYGDEEDC